MAKLTKAAFERQMKLEKLDSALLVLPSSLGLIITIINSLLAPEWLIYFLPILFPAWVMPIYVGYIRGALILDRLEERLRGWIYFVAGGGFYFAFYIVAMVSIKLNPPTWLLTGIDYIGFAIAFFVVRFTAKQLVPKIFGIYGRKVTARIREIVISTFKSSLCLGAFFITLLIGVTQIVPVGIIEIIKTAGIIGVLAKLTLSIWVAMCVGFLIGFRHHEIKSRRLVETHRR
jgi:hypothetical protein